MSGVTVAEIKEQEEALFNEGKIFRQPNASSSYHRARVKALQQLALSEDSPFNLDDGTQEQSKQQLVTLSEEEDVNDDELSHSVDDKTRLLREETEEIKRQLDLIRLQINELHLRPGGSPEASGRGHQEAKAQPKQTVETSAGHPIATSGERRHEFVHNQQLTSADSQFHRNLNEGPAHSLVNTNDTNPRLRPLTGKTDCPNCACDRRRSVCDTCMEFQKQIVVQGGARESIRRQPTFITEQQIDSLISSGKHDQAPSARAEAEHTTGQRHHDERPIRPARQRLEDVLDSMPDAHQAATARDGREIADRGVDQAVVPGRLYTIGKSLNEKRTKLAQAIEELQLMMEKVKKRGDRLEQERKVAQLYKGQWKFGPSIGGSSSSLAASGRRGSSESLRVGVASTYQSRLDPNLARDTNSMMGFQHVGPSITRNSRPFAGGPSSLSQLPPKPKPRLSKLNSTRLANASNLYRRPTRASALHARSKSIESLHSQPITTKVRRQPTASERLQVGEAKAGNKAVPVVSAANLLKGKSSSNIDLTSSARKQQSGGSSSSPDSSAAVEEDLEQDEIREDDEGDLERAQPDSRPTSSDSIRRVDVTASNSPKKFEREPGGREAGVDDNSDHKQQSPQQHPRESRKRTWVPVFGETEIKTIDRRPSQRKVVAFNAHASTPATGSSNKSILRTSQSSAISKRGSPNDRVLNEATKKLQFASDLLERERHDSTTSNQVIVNKMRPVASPRSNFAASERPSRQRPLVASRMTRKENGNGHIPGSSTTDTRPLPNNATHSIAGEALAKNLISGANKEITRLEEMIAEQQALLVKLTQATSQSSACCHHQPTPCSSDRGSPVSSQSRSSSQRPGRLLIANLRERLNKTKAKLTRTLEQERSKYQQLEQRVDSSLRKQSDLENENKLLKSSLNKCLDTCLRDILSTFESLSDTLGEPTDVEPLGDGDQLAPVTADSGGDVSPLIGNAAQLIADNRHLKRMRSHIDSIERQRKAIFEELNQEKHKTQQLESELRQSKLELEQLVGAKARLEAQFPEESQTLPATGSGPIPSNLEAQPVASTPKQVNFEASTSIQAGAANDQSHAQVTATDGSPQQQQPISEQCNSCNLLTSSTNDDTTSMTYNSIDTYRQYIQSMTPDLDAIRRERRMILEDFDNIKKMLSDMDNN